MGCWNKRKEADWSSYCSQIVACLRAGGDYVPPVLIFPRKNWSARLMKGAPPGSLGRCHPSGCIQSHVFTEWLVHFIQHTRLSAESPIMLILDGHYSHTRNMEVIVKAKENPISLVCLPPNTIHRLQPLDRTFMGPLKTYYSEEIRRLLKTGVGINIHDIAESLGNANRRTQTGAIAVNDFKCTGIYPLNRNIFTDADFAEEEQRHVQVLDTSNNVEQSQDTNETSELLEAVSNADDFVGVQADQPQPNDTPADSSLPNDQASSPFSVLLQPEDFSPIPQQLRKATSRVPRTVAANRPILLQPHLHTKRP